MLRNKLKYILPLALVWLSALIAAGFFDLEISMKLADPMSPFGRFFELAGEPPAILFTAFNFSVAAVCLLKRSERSYKRLFLAAILIALMVGTTYYTVNATFGYIKSWRTELGLGFLGSGTKLFWVLLITALVSMLLLQLAFRQKHSRLEAMLPSAVHCILAAVLTLAIIWAFKLLWGRVRFRQLDELSQFTAFFIPNGFTGYFSFPSGHTANATVILTISYYFGSAIKSPRFSRLILLILSSWTIIVALSRVLVGAHYLSDVLCGWAITAIIVYFCKPKKTTA